LDHSDNRPHIGGDVVNTVVLIACVGEKRDHRARAEDLYVSDLFRKSLAYARKIERADIFILSAKYGLVHRTEEIDPYDLTLKNMKAAQRKAWSECVFDQLRARTDVESDHFVFLAGVKYRQYLIPRLRSTEVPMEGLGIGDQLHWLGEHLR
jgi:hypothetical protein